MVRVCQCRGGQHPLWGLCELRLLDRLSVGVPAAPSPQLLGSLR